MIPREISGIAEPEGQEAIFAFCSPSDIVQVRWAFVKGDVSQHVGRGGKDRAARLWLARGCGED